MEPGFLLAILLLGAPAARSNTDLIAKAEKEFYAFQNPSRFEATEEALKQLEKADPKEPYLYWARARVAFFRKESIYLRENKSNAEQLKTEKLALADDCHRNSDRCLELAPKNPECHLLKGSCYAMQASTWGPSWSGLWILDNMDEEWEAAMTLPSHFAHGANVTTRQLAEILRGILYRAVPDSWWISLVAGMRGSKQKSYDWLKDAVIGACREEPYLQLELASSALCLSVSTKRPELAEEGTSILKTIVALTPRYAQDEFDKTNAAYLLEHPDQACNYRRERIEDLSADSVKKNIESSSR